MAYFECFWRFRSGFWVILEAFLAHFAFWTILSVMCLSHGIVDKDNEMHTPILEGLALDLGLFWKVRPGF